MKAWKLYGVGDFRFEETQEPKISYSQVLIKVKNVSICGSDIPRVYETGAHKMPLAIGHEFSGEVVQTGAEVNASWKGKRVGIFPLIPCGKCIACQKLKYEMCRHYSYLGSRCDGGFAEYVAVPEWNLIPLPDEVSYEEAAMLEPMAVAVHAMRRVEISTEDVVVICGLGTIGMLLTMFLLEKGIKNILVIGNKAFQKEEVLSLGISEENYCDCRAEDVKDWIIAHTSGNGADVFFECVGKNETISEAVDAVAPGGRICLVGNPYSDVFFKKEIYWKILRNQIQLTGTWNSSFTHDEDDDWHYVLKKLKERKIQPANLISHKYSLEDIVEGFHIMRDKSEDYIKIMAICE